MTNNLPLEFNYRISRVLRTDEPLMKATYVKSKNKYKVKEVGTSIKCSYFSVDHVKDALKNGHWYIVVVEC